MKYPEELLYERVKELETLIAALRAENAVLRAKLENRDA